MKIALSLKVIRLVLVITSILSCKKDKVPDVPCTSKLNSIDIVKQLLPATYFWSYTVISFQGGGSTETPASTGLIYKYIFYKHGKVAFYENAVLKSIDKYVVDYEFKVTTFPSDSATIIIINDNQTGQRKEFFRPYLCNDSSLFYNPYSSIDSRSYFKRN
jgi:hypothetical protein